PKETELNSALILLSAFGGLNLFGFLGIIYGPVIMIFLVTTIEIYLEHYRLDQPAVPEDTPTRPQRRSAPRKKPPGKSE
ncbi:MAG: AI-2E family transporter, partial [Calditrichaeota bacterium]|nr:AI-2E family transporter [Calditrichota bacterium]